MRKFRVLIVEDEPLIAEDIAGVLEEIGFEPAAILHDAESAISFLKKDKPDAALLDINLGLGPDGIEVAKFIRAECDMPFVFLTGQSDRATVDRAKVTFPEGYLLKPFDPNDLMINLELALHNYRKHTPERDLRSGVMRLAEKLNASFSERELELLEHLAEGKTNREIAEALFISVNTVKTHFRNLFEKLDARNRTEALFRMHELSKG